MEGNKLTLPKFKLESNLLRLHYTFASLLDMLVEELNKIPQLEDLKLNQDLTKLLCTVVEEVNLNKSIKGKIDKKNLVIQVLVKVFNLTEDEQLIISNNIDFMCDNKLIQKSSLCTKMFKLFF